MKNASNSYAKSKALREYPNDYSMQKYIYDKAAYQLLIVQVYVSIKKHN